MKIDIMGFNLAVVITIRVWAKKKKDDNGHLVSVFDRKNFFIWKQDEYTLAAPDSGEWLANTLTERLNFLGVKNRSSHATAPE